MSRFSFFCSRIWACSDFKSEALIDALHATLLGRSSSARRKRTGRHWLRRSTRVTIRSKSCCIFSKVCHHPRCGLRRTTNRHGRFPSMAKRIQLLSLISSLRRLRRIRICESFNSTWLRLGFCQTTMHSSGWRGNRDDAGLVSADESARASAQKQIAARRATLAEQALYVKERDLWTKRDEWIRQHQPILKNPAEASALLDQLKEIAGKYNILFENVNLAIDGSDPTMMRGKFKIARWFAPAQRTK